MTPPGAQSSAFTPSQPRGPGARPCLPAPGSPRSTGADLGPWLLTTGSHPATPPRQAGGHTYLQTQVALDWGGVCSGAAVVRTAAAVRGSRTRLAFLPLEHCTLRHSTPHTPGARRRLSSPSLARRRKSL